MTSQVPLSRIAIVALPLVGSGGRDKPRTPVKVALKMYLFLTTVDAQKKESKPSKAFELLTHDRFLEE